MYNYKNWHLWYLLIVLVAIFIRLIPAITNTLWGVDFGIYYGITKTFIETGSFFNPYYGWGGSYNQFPVLYAIGGGFHWLTGLPVSEVLMKIVPVFGGLSVAVFFFVSKELLTNVKHALMATALLAVMPVHVYQTAHVAPLTIGHFFMVLSIYFFIKQRKDVRYLLPLALSSALLVMTHHLTTYMYLIVIMFVIFYDNWSYKEWKPYFRRELLYLLCVSGFIFSYWKFVATKVYDSFMQKGFIFGYEMTPIIIILGFYAVIGFGIALIIFRRKADYYKVHNKYPHPLFAKMLFFVIFILAIAIIFVFSYRNTPWVIYKLNILAIPYLIPFIFVLGFGAVGFFTHRSLPHGDFLRGWIIAISLSFIVSLVFGSAMEYNRHFEYFMVPIAAVAVYGVIFFLKEHFFRREFVYIVVILVLVIANAATVYPAYDILEVEESISDSDVNVMLFVSGNITKNDTVICSDHRIERLFESFGYNTTKDFAKTIWNTTHLDELFVYSIDYVFIDKQMCEDGIHNSKYGLIFMTPQSYAKFKRVPFKLVYRYETNESWAEFYKVMV